MTMVEMHADIQGGSDIHDDNDVDMVTTTVTTRRDSGEDDDQLAGVMTMAAHTAWLVPNLC